MTDKKYEFNIGDIVVCTDDVDAVGLTYGKDYQIAAVYLMSVRLTNQPNQPWSKYRFTLASDVEPKEPKLTLPIVYISTFFPEDLRLLVRGSEGKVSVFEEGLFAADEWTDEEAISNILSGVWRVQSVGNASFGGD